MSAVVLFSSGGCSIFYLQRKNLTRHAVVHIAGADLTTMKVDFDRLPLSDGQKEYLDKIGAYSRKVFSFSNDEVRITGIHIPGDFKRGKMRYGAAIIVDGIEKTSFLLDLGLSDSNRFRHLDPDTKNPWFIYTVDDDGNVSNEFLPGEMIYLEPGSITLCIAVTDKVDAAPGMLPKFSVKTVEGAEIISPFWFNRYLLK